MTSGTNYRSIFISDFHLGSKHCKAKRLLEFLNTHTADRVYLVGDVLDHSTYLGGWPPFHNEVLLKLGQMSTAGTSIIYIPGNHDDVFRYHIGRYGNLVIVNHWVHRTVDGRKLLITHGDETDMLGIGWLLNLFVKIERYVPIPFWEILRKFFRHTIRSHTIKFQKKMMLQARGYAGVICGHVHYPHLSQFYMNCGDWVHHCTAIVEHHNGSFELLKG